MKDDTADKFKSHAGPTRPHVPQRKIAERVERLIADRNGLLPVWVRAPVVGPEHYSGFSRAKLYQLVAAGKIRSVSIREPGQIKGVRLFELASILSFIEERATAAEAVDEPAGEKQHESIV